MTQVTILGLGPGDEGFMTQDVRAFLACCDAIIGAKSVVDGLAADKPVFYEYDPEKVKEVLESHPEFKEVALVMRGDVGFYSGAKKLLQAFPDARLLPGMPSPVVFAAKLGVSWDDAALISLHGRNSNLLQTVSKNRKTFALSGGDNTAEKVIDKLCEYKMQVKVTVGTRLSYPDEKLFVGTPQELKGQSFDPLAILYIENENAIDIIRTGIPDEEFIRGDVPMTKSEVRAISLSKLALCADSVVWDIGAGTGSVSVECALSAHKGQVYAIEKKPEASELIRQNKIKFRTDNIEIVEGSAPQALADLPAPTHVFIGGSAGNLREILSLILEKNPAAKIVINAITLETQAEAKACGEMFNEFEAVSVNISRSRTAGDYHLMNALNPVWIFTMRGGK